MSGFHGNYDTLASLEGCGDPRQVHVASLHGMNKNKSIKTGIWTLPKMKSLYRVIVVIMTPAQFSYIRW